MVDTLDEQIINLLSQDAYQSSVALAKILDVSPSTIRRRINRLVEQGTINVVALPQPGELGRPLRAIIAFDVAHEYLDTALEKLRQKDEIKWLSATTGRYDIVAIGWFGSTDELYDFMGKDVAQIKEIRDSETFICLQVVKRF